MHLPQKSQRWAALACAAILGLLLGSASAVAQLTISSNPHYFNYNGTPTKCPGTTACPP
jgi:hypothetical protein